jgi:hypothetical protein
VRPFYYDKHYRREDNGGNRQEFSDPVHRGEFTERFNVLDRATLKGLRGMSGAIFEGWSGERITSNLHPEQEIPAFQTELPCCKMEISPA